MIKAIIFDFAGVIGTDGYWVWLKDAVWDLSRRKHEFEFLADKLDKGRISTREFDRTIGRKVRVSATNVKQQIFERIHINQPLVQIIAQLHKNYQTAILSNFNQTRLEELLTKYRITSLFDIVVCSSTYGFIKPEPKAYITTLELLKVKPEETVFIDDRQGHVGRASRLGIHGLLYTSVARLMKDLESIGVKI